MIHYCISDFISNFDELERHLQTVSFDGEVNPVDGVLYPDISTDIPDGVLQDILNFLETKYEIEHLSIPFMRRMTDGLKPPHPAHSDRVMGTHSLMFYLTAPKGKTGTALLKHKRTNSLHDKGNDESLECFVDTNNYDAWDEVDFIAMEKNKLCIFDADRWHRAEPVQGYGSCNSNSRIVLTWFFTAKKRAKHDNNQKGKF